MGIREDRKKTFAQIWEEERIKNLNQKKDELKKNKGLIKLGKRKVDMKLQGDVSGSMSPSK